MLQQRAPARPLQAQKKAHPSQRPRLRHLRGRQAARRCAPTSSAASRSIMPNALKTGLTITVQAFWLKRWQILAQSRRQGTCFRPLAARHLFYAAFRMLWYSMIYISFLPCRHLLRSLPTRTWRWRTLPLRRPPLRRPKPARRPASLLGRPLVCCIPLWSESGACRTICREAGRLYAVC